MKYATALLITAALGLGAAQTAPVSSASAVQTQNAASDPALSQANITIETGRYQGPLSGLLGAIAKSAGYELVLEVNVDTLAAEGEQARPVAYSFRNKPFNEVWPLLMDVYGLNYSVTELGGQPVIRVSNTPVQRVVKLQNADPAAAAEQVKLFFGTPVYSEVAQTNAAGANVATSRTLVDVKLDSPTLRIIPDTRNRSVIVRGTNAEITEVERLLRELDRDPRGALAAESAGPNVQEIYSVNGDIKELSNFVSAEFPNLRVTTVGSSKQLVLRGGQGDVEQALTLLTKVDPAPGQTTQRVFQLVNASAEELADTLMATLARDLTSTTATAASTSTASGANTANNAAGAPTTNTPVSTAATAPTQMATILPDARTNTIIVRGTPAQVAQVAELIPTLDREVPQINLQVRIQEITESAQRSLGVDWKIGFGGFNIGLISSGTSPSGLTASFDPTRSLVGFNIFPTLNALETQSQAKRVYDGVITMQSGQRSLGSNATNGSRNASDGAAATIKSGGKLELNIPDGEGGSIEKVIDYGVILDFFEPVVAPDGTITLRVRGQVNDLLNEDAITPGTLPYLLRFTNSEAQTRISFKSGETVLLSGLLGTTESNTKAGLPFLSMIPGVGALAGNQSTNRDSTQMLFVITGDIIE
ncbi:hypothetical protein GCM10017783_09450 [Deinococcus piscis]|uniref:Type II and III secretion system protein n=1 Tax=Deinococcus piscis TaxID=394230 RepID=A0ABQ3K1Z7_9DEIO|nr:secretin N-terminal domain-containing protein [Deinococcus piscis]GHF99500.1 hypothetical protein GCM10017783_09450 [Deinococcus piscis]